MRDLEYRPRHLVPLLALVRRVLCVFHLVLKLEKGVFDVFEAVWWRLASTARANRRHVD